MNLELITFTNKGLYCPSADLYIDPWKPVDKAVVTHAHSDHARWGHAHYLAHKDSESVLRYRLGKDINLQTVDYNQQVKINDVTITLYPAGHTIGSSQIKVENKKEKWVISGDYKLENDGISGAFEPVACDVFISEATFGLPIFNWELQDNVINDIQDWWLQNQQENRTSILTAYAFGKAQRILHNIDPSLGPIYVHGAIYNTNEVLRAAGIPLSHYKKVTDASIEDLSKALVLTVDSSLGTPWINRFTNKSIAKASGWMQVRGFKRRAALDRGFVISDHADWEGLMQAVKATQAQKILFTHGFTYEIAKYCTELGIDAGELHTEFLDNGEEGQD